MRTKDGRARELLVNLRAACGVMFWMLTGLAILVCIAAVLGGCDPNGEDIRPPAPKISRTSESSH